VDQATNIANKTVPSGFDWGKARDFDSCRNPEKQPG